MCQWRKLIFGNRNSGLVLIRRERFLLCFFRHQKANLRFSKRRSNFPKRDGCLDSAALWLAPDHRGDECSRTERRAPKSRSERIEKIDQVILLLSAETNVEALIIEVYYVQQSGSRAIVEVRRPRSQPPQDGPFDLANIGAMPGNQSTTRISDHEDLSGKWPLPPVQL